MGQNTSDRDEVVVSGLGAVSPLGVGVRSLIGGLRAGRSGVSLLPAPMRTSGRIASTAAARCTGFDPSTVMPPADLKRVPRLVPMALAAATEAMRHAGLEPGSLSEPDARRTALVLGTGGGGIDFTIEQLHKIHRSEQPSLWTITNATHGNLAGELSIRLGLHGPSHCISDGCASSSNAIMLAAELLTSDRPNAPHTAIVVGADAHVTEEVLMSMELLGVVSTRRCETEEDAARASRPFCKTRDGFILGEGAYAVVLQRLGAVRTKPLARVAGWSSTCDAHHRVRPEPSMAESARAMSEAIEHARLRPTDIDIVHYHGTATQLNDALETKAVKLALGPHAHETTGHSVKSQLGHPQGACGAAAVVGTLGALAAIDEDPNGPFVPPTLNLIERDGDCDLDYCTDGPRDTDAKTVLVNCLAFGAKNSALVFSRDG